MFAGEPLGDLPHLARIDENTSDRKSKVPSLPATKSTDIHPPATITFVRNRMLYARAALNVQGKVVFGLRHFRMFPSPSLVSVTYLADVLNRYPYVMNSKFDGKSRSPPPNTIHVMMHLFPRQFGLHDVFTAEVDSRETVQPFKDYTLREDEIHTKFSSEASIKIPKRLRGKASELVHKLQIRHSRCPYKILLEYYCPVSAVFFYSSFLNLQWCRFLVRTQDP